MGLDIGCAAIKLVELIPLKEGYRVTAVSTAAIPPSTMNGNHIKNVHLMSQVLDDLTHRSKAISRRAVVSVASSLAIIKTIEVDATVPAHLLEDLIFHQARQHIPYPLEEVAMDFVIEGKPRRQDRPFKVLLVACRNEHIRIIQKALDLAGIFPVAIETDADALRRACILTQRTVTANDKTRCAIVDIGASGVRLSVLTGARLVYSKAQQFTETSWSQHTSTPSAEWNESDKTGTRNKRENHLPAKQTQAVEQITRALQFFSSASPYSTVDQILLAGGIAATPGLAKFVHQRLAIPARTVNPFIGMQMTSDVQEQTMGNSEPALATACGLAMRGKHR